MSPKRTTEPSKAARSRITDKYKPSFPALLIMLVAECGLITTKSEIAWSRIARAMQVHKTTLARWRDPRVKKYYKHEFALAAKEAMAMVNADEIKRSMITRGRGYNRMKKTVTVAETEEGTLTTTRTEREKMLGDVAAARLVLANIGPVEARWTDKETLMINDERLSEEECENVRKILQENLG